MALGYQVEYGYPEKVICISNRQDFVIMLHMLATAITNVRALWL